MSNQLMDAINIYYDIMAKNKKIEDLTDVEKNAYILVTRDSKLMSILGSFDPGAIPSLVDIIPKYNRLCDEEKAKKAETTNNVMVTETQEVGTPVAPAAPVVPEAPAPVDTPVEPDVRMTTQPQEAINNARRRAMKLNQVGYANVVLMSIIVIIIVAIICVFIFM
ncbi:MAG: hypothetical protein IKF37_01055 [Bacilli bacterium]|nr:hypothetical protein [Bacilli bacterium]